MKMYSIRKADLADLEELRKIEEKCFDKSLRENFEIVLSSDSHYYFVVLNNLKDIVAYAGMSISYEQGDVLSVAVAPDYRRLGLAKGVLKEVLIQAKNKGVQTMFLEVEEDNVPAINLYSYLGFAEISRRKNYYGNKTAIIMSKNL